MAAAGYVVPWRGSRLGGALAARPEWWVYLLSAGAWAGLGVTILDPGTSAGHGHHAHGVQGAASSVTLDSAFYLLMVAAMMLPLVAPAVRYVVRATLWRRRHRMAAYYVAGFGATWAAFGVSAVGARTALHIPVDHAGWIAGAAALAALWQAQRVRRRALKRCGDRPGLGLSGWRASCRALQAGGRHGVRCVATCGPSMLLMCVTHSVLLMVAVFGLQGYERRAGPNPFAEKRWQAPATAFATIAAVAAVNATLA